MIKWFKKLWEEYKFKRDIRRSVAIISKAKSLKNNSETLSQKQLIQKIQAKAEYYRWKNFDGD